MKPDDRSASETRTTEYTVGNTLLDSLSAEVLASIAHKLRVRHLVAGESLYAGLAIDELDYFYFPISAVTSMTTVLSDGDLVEALPVGFEGLAGFQVIFGSTRMLEGWTCAVPGTVAQMRVPDFWSVLATSAALGRILLCYNQALITALATAVACNAKHTVEQRCAKWLMLTHDRVRLNDFPMTHEFLASLLGVRRAGVSLVAAALQRDGCIKYARGVVSILDRDVLGTIACECYGNITEEYVRVMARSRVQSSNDGPGARWSQTMFDGRERNANGQ
jgi:CRP-like cAMP-binding protein